MLRNRNRTHGHFSWHKLGWSLLGWQMVINIIIYLTQAILTYTLSTFTPIIIN